MDKALAAKAYLRQQARKAADYFKPTENVRVRDFVREVPGAVGQMFSGTRDTFVKGGKILGEGAAYALDPNVRRMYAAGNTDILPTISNTTPRQMLANTAKAAFEIAPVGKIKGLATAAMSARLAPRMAAGGAIGYGYGVADEMSKPGPMNKDTFAGPNPILSLLGGALLGGIAKPATKMVGRSINEMASDVRNLNPANRIRHKVVGVHDIEPTGIFAAGGIPQMGENPHTYRQEVKTTVDPFEPQSYLARVLMGKQSPIGNTIQAVDDPLLQEANIPKTAKVWIKSKFSNDGAYADIPVIRKEDNITLYQGGKPGDKRQFWTPDKKYAEQFGNVREKTGSFYRVNNGNTMTDVYVEAPSVSKPQENPLISEARKLTPEEHARGVLAARDAGGVQAVGAKNVAAAEKTLQKAGELPMEIKTPTVSKDYIRNYYETKKAPVVGDTFVNAKGERIEITKVEPGQIRYFLKGKNKGIEGIVYTDKPFYKAPSTDLWKKATKK